MFLRGLKGTIDRQIAIAGYPGTQPIVESPRWGVHPYVSTGIVLSKYTVKGGLLDDPMDTSPTFGAGSSIDSTMQVKTSENGRIVGNSLTDSDGKCSNGWHGAISSGEMGGSNVKIFGNYIYELGCRQTSHFHHTTYMSKRDTSNSQPSIAWEYGWNRLEGNKAKFGIHSYDQSPFDSRNCGDVTGTLRIHHNYIKDQRGAGVNLSTKDYDDKDICWTTDVVIDKNVLINTGLGPVSELNNGTAPYGISVGGDIGGNVEITSNLILDVSDPSAREYGTAAAINLFLRNTSSTIIVSKNIVTVSDDITLIRKETKNHSILSNIWYSESRSAESIQDEVLQLGSTLDNRFYDPEISILGNSIIVGIPAMAKSVTYQGALALVVNEKAQEKIGFYGSYSSSQDIGPFYENFSPPNPPSIIEAK
ncbi:hypothetical protein MELB17_14291 [Marinobacter sp. ELB17]|nr:hypothetical protein MELB17_14291 [Marinobacter sp. ELB17]